MFSVIVTLWRYFLHTDFRIWSISFILDWSGSNNWKICALIRIYDIYSALVSSVLFCHCSSDAFRSQLVLLKKDNDRLLKTAYIRLLSLG